MTTPLSGMVVCGLGRAMINLHIEFDVSMFTQYEDMKGNAKCRHYDGLGGSHPRSSVT